MTKQKVFVSSLASNDIQTLRELLSSSEIDSVSWEELPPIELREGLADVLNGCNGLVAYINEDGVAPAVMFEIGMAVGIGKVVILLVLDWEVLRDLPPVLAGLPAVILDQSTESGALDRIVDLLKIHNAARPLAPIVQSPVGERYAEGLDPQSWGGEYEKLVGEQLARLGARVVPQAFNSPGQVDLAAWIPGLPGPELNPILIEVAGRRPAIGDRLSQLRGFLSTRNLSLGMLVLQESHAPDWTILDRTAVVTIGLEQLKILNPDELTRLMMTGRNRLVHS
jgi:hypothetical protein